MKTPTSLYDLMNLIADKGISVDRYEGSKLVYGDTYIGLVSVDDKWTFKKYTITTTYSTEELKNNLDKIVKNL